MASVTVRQESKVLQSVYSSISEMSSSGSDDVSRDMDSEKFDRASVVIAQYQHGPVETRRGVGFDPIFGSLASLGPTVETETHTCGV
jgi:hypothetical protein